LSDAPVTPAAPVEAAPAPVVAAAPVGAAPVAPAAEAVTDLPGWAQKIITDARKEAGDFRVAAKNAEQSITDKIATALGLKPDAAVDPAALTASLTEAQTKATQSARELAIFKAAAHAGADPSKLLDSNSFTSSVSGLDPTDGAAITAAITAAVAANPNLKAVLAAAASGTELGGTGEQGQISEQQLAAMSPEEINTALKAGKLAHLL